MTLLRPETPTTPASAETPTTPASTPAFGPASALACRECGTQTAIGAHYVCLECFGPLEVVYSTPRVTRESIAAAAARAGLRSVVFVPSDLEAGKTVTTAVYGGTLVAVEGSYDDVNRLCSEVAADEPWGFVNINLRPFYAEGSKTVGFEVAEQL